MASVDRRHRDEGKLVAACCHHRPLIIAAKKLVRDTLRMEQIFGVRSLPAQNAEDGLDEERRRDQLPVEKVSQGIEMPDIIAFKLETSAMPLAERPEDRSEERRVGKECVRTCRSRRSPQH